MCYGKKRRWGNKLFKSNSFSSYISIGSEYLELQNAFNAFYKDSKKLAKQVGELKILNTSLTKERDKLKKGELWSHTIFV